MQEEQDNTRTALEQTQSGMNDALHETDARATAQEGALAQQEQDIKEVLQHANDLAQKNAAEILSAKSELKSQEGVADQQASEASLSIHKQLEEDQAKLKEQEQAQVDARQHMAQTAQKLDEMQKLEDKAATDASLNEAQVEQGIEGVVAKLSTAMAELAQAEQQNSRATGKVSAAQGSVSAMKAKVAMFRKQQQDSASEHESLLINSRSVEAEREEAESTEQDRAKVETEGYQAVSDKAKTEFDVATRALEQASDEANADADSVVKRTRVEMAQSQHDSAEAKHEHSQKHLLDLENTLQLLVTKATARKTSFEESKQSMVQERADEVEKESTLHTAAQAKLQEAEAAVKKAKVDEQAAKRSRGEKQAAMQTLKAQKKTLQGQTPEDNVGKMDAEIQEAKKQLIEAKAKERVEEAEIGDLKHSVEQDQVNEGHQAAASDPIIRDIENKLSGLQEAQSNAEEEGKMVSQKLARKDEELKKVEAARSEADQEIENARASKIKDDQDKLSKEGTSVTELNTEIGRLKQEQQIADQVVQQDHQNKADEEQLSAVERTALEVKLEQKESQEQQKQTSLNLQREELTAALEEVKEAHNSVMRERTQAAKAEEQVKDVSTQVAQAEGDKQQISEKTSSSLEGSEAKLRTMKSQVEQQEDQLRALGVGVNTTQSKISTLKRELGFATKDVERAEQRHTEMMEKAAHFRSMTQRIQADADDLKSTREMKMEVAVSALDDLTAAKQDLKDHTQEFEQKKAPYHAEQQQLEGELKRAEEQLKSKKKTMLELETKLGEQTKQAKAAETALADKDFSKEMAGEMAPMTS